MTARYHVLVSDDLLPPGPDWEVAGLTLIETGEAVMAQGMHWCLFEDRDADESLDGKKVDVWFGAHLGRPVITRRMMTGA